MARELPKPVEHECEGCGAVYTADGGTLLGPSERRHNGTGSDTTAREAYAIGPCCFPAMLGALRSLRD